MTSVIWEAEDEKIKSIHGSSSWVWGFGAWSSHC